MHNCLWSPWGVLDRCWRQWYQATCQPPCSHWLYHEVQIELNISLSSLEVWPPFLLQSVFIYLALFLFASWSSLHFQACFLCFFLRFQFTLFDFWVLVKTSFPGGGSGKESACQCRRLKRHGLDSWVGKIAWRRKWQLTPVFLPGKSHGQRNLVGCVQAQKESDTTEHMSINSLQEFLES